MKNMWERTARQIEADAVDDLAGHKRLQSPEGQQFVQALRGYHDERTDPLMPWLAREYRKGRVMHNPADGGTLRYFDPDPQGRHQNHLGQRGVWHQLRPESVNHWADWYHQPDRRKVPLEQLQVHLMQDEVGAYERAKAKRLQDEGVEEGRHQGEVVHSWPDGWTLRKLPTGKALDFEAWNMRGDPDRENPHGAPICVNWPQYQRGVADGDNLIYSLRDPQGNPHVTTEINPSEHLPICDHCEAQAVEPNARGWYECPNCGNSGYDYARARAGLPQNGEIVQIQGKGNSVPKPEYQARMKDWFQTFPEDVRPMWDDGDGIIHVGQLMPEGTGARDDYDMGDHGGAGGQGGYGPHGDYGLDPTAVYWGDMVESLHPHHVESNERDPEAEARAMYDFARQRGQVPELANALLGAKVPPPHWRRGNPGQPHQTRLDHFRDEFNDLWDRYQDNDGAPWWPGDSYDEDPERWQSPEEFEEASSQYKSWEEDALPEARGELPHFEAANNLYEHLQPHRNPQTGAYENEPVQQATFSKVDSAQPFRHLWAFSPQSGQVHLYNEADHHPAEAPTHDSIAADLGEVGLHHGYAYSIPGGWRVLDYHHEPVADPFVLRNVVENLRKQTRP